MTIEQFIKMILQNVKSKQWLNCTESVTLDNGQNVSIGVKAFGLWVQRLECNGRMDSSSMALTTQKELKQWLNDAIKAITL